MIAKYENSYEKSSNCNYGNYLINDKTSLNTTDCEMINGTYDCFDGLLKAVISEQFPLNTTYSYALSHDCKFHS